MNLTLLTKESIESIENIDPKHDPTKPFDFYPLEAMIQESVIQSEPDYILIDKYFGVPIEMSKAHRTALVRHIVWRPGIRQRHKYLRKAYVDALQEDMIMGPKEAAYILVDRIKDSRTNSRDIPALVTKLGEVMDWKGKREIEKLNGDDPVRNLLDMIQPNKALPNEK